MKRQILRLSPHQTAKVLAAVYFLISAIVILLVILILWLTGVDRAHPPIPLLLLYPFGGAISSYITVALFCLFYNFAAKRVGGIELLLSECDEER